MRHHRRGKNREVEDDSCLYPKKFGLIKLQAKNRIVCIAKVLLIASDSLTQFLLYELSECVCANEKWEYCCLSCSCNKFSLLLCLCMFAESPDDVNREKFQWPPTTAVLFRLMMTLLKDLTFFGKILIIFHLKALKI